MYNVFTSKKITFPKGFLWGSGVAGHQVEGMNVNSHCWENEKKLKPDNRSGRAIDHYNRYPEDISLLRALGHKAFRTSVEWSRIQPSEGAFNEKALAHYLDEFALLKKNGIKRFLTLHHLSHPQWFEEKGGWAKEGNLKYFEKYLKLVLPRLAGAADFWHTSNEFNLYPPEKKVNALKAHALAYRLIKKYSKKPVSYAHAFALQKPYNPCSKADIAAAKRLDWLKNEGVLNAVRSGRIDFPGRKVEFVPDLKGALDFWSINYYTRHMINASGKTTVETRYDHKIQKMIEMDFYMEEFYPEGIIEACMRVSDKPIFITENGVSCKDDAFRIANLSLTLNALSEAIEMGADVRGYLHWSTFDNYEWDSFVPRFGLVKVDFKTFKRSPKPSAYFYREVIKNNGFYGKMAAKYISKIPTIKH